MTRTAVVTGAGSGVGRAVALRLAAEQWNVVLLGRRPEALDETARQARANRNRMHPRSTDITQAADVAQMAAEALNRYGAVDVLVNAAGTNVPRRSFEQLALEDYRRILATNLDGAYLCVQAFLPSMRQRRSGTIVNIVSDAGLKANAKAGPAYVVSKFALTGLTQSINEEERGNGIRACAIFPGDIDTPLLEKRPAPPSPEARARMLQPEDVAECVMLAIDLPDRAVVEQLVVRPR